jgi:hypothetical protein
MKKQTCDCDDGRKWTFDSVCNHERPWYLPDGTRSEVRKTDDPDKVQHVCPDCSCVLSIASPKDID